ncbi:hypothetical protein J3S85_23420 [Streptomyces lavenduligriseus]|nr:hypothetical protein J3S85_23420 [Streptomyces lavenduligriseus]
MNAVRLLAANMAANTPLASRIPTVNPIPLSPEQIIVAVPAVHRRVGR